jgi:hypothetical protein
MTGKRNLFLGLLIGLVLGSALSAFQSFDSTSAQDSRTVLLRQGWNQLVWTADNQLADTALSAIADDLAIVYGWQGDSQTFSRCVPGRADVSTMTMLERDSGYWLLLKRDVSLTMPASTVECPAPTPCPQCADTTAALAQYQLQEGCTAQKIYMELGEITGVDMADHEQFFNQNCQGVTLLEGSPLGDACAGAGLVSAGVLIPGKQAEGAAAAVLLGQYCVP